MCYATVLLDPSSCSDTELFFESEMSESEEGLDFIMKIDKESSEEELDFFVALDIMFATEADVG